MSMITLSQADKIIDAIIVRARELKCRPISVVVVEPGAIVKAFKKEDGSAMMRFEMAMGKAYAALAAGGVSVFKREIVAVVMDDRPGGLLAATQALSKAGINIEDAYGFVIEDKRRAVLVVEVEKIPEAIDVLREQGLRTLSDDEIYTL